MGCEIIYLAQKPSWINSEYLKGNVEGENKIKDWNFLQKPQKLTTTFHIWINLALNCKGKCQNYMKAGNFIITVPHPLSPR